MSNSKPLRLGLIGCGGFGRFCLEAYLRLDSVRIAAVADSRVESAEQFSRDFSVPAFSDPTELIARQDVDIVHIATPPSSHYELVMAAVRAGKHVLCEKPLAISVAQADEMLLAAREAGVIAPVNFVLRHNPVTEAVKAIIDSGVLGKVLSARLTNCAQDGGLPPDHWFWDKSISGGIFVEHGVHFFDLYSHWFGPGRVISAHTETRDGTTQEDRVMCTVRHESGAVASHYHGFDQLEFMDRTDHRIVCEQGDIFIDGWIPLTLTLDAAVDEKSAVKLAELCPGCHVETDQIHARATSRGKQRHITERIFLEYCPHPDKQALYAHSVESLLSDQIAYLRDSSHVRSVTEQNGRDALDLACSALEHA